MKNFDELAIKPCNILIPQNSDIHEKWAVIACDQYTSQPEYWEKVSQITAGFPSSLNITFPEVYLEDDDCEKRIETINANMKEYLDTNIFQTLKNSFILVERTLPGGASRKGLVAAIDLEHYDYSPDSSSLVRATEGTVLERIPPRVKIRENAPLELPHIMILIDDPEKTVIEPLFEKSLPKIYDFDLMMYSGHLTGYQISNPDDHCAVFSALKNLMSKCPLLYAVGDGNHSLASAKAYWTALKETLSPEEISGHPARYALAELVNLHDDSLVFEPIHRICTETNPEEFLQEFKKYFSNKPETGNIQKFNYIHGNISGEIEIPNCTHTLEIGTLQEFLTAYSSKIKVDYIHGSDVVKELAAKPDSIGFILPVMHKNLLFKSVSQSGVLPRKTFSMGEAYEKRFYFECREIK